MTQKIVMTMLSCQKVLHPMRICPTRMIPIPTMTFRCPLVHHHQEMRLRYPKVGNLFPMLHILIAFTRRPTTTTNTTTSATHIYEYPARCSTSPDGSTSWPTIPTPTAWSRYYSPTAWFCYYPPTTSRFCDRGCESPTRCYPWPANGLTSVPTQSSPSTSAPDQLSGQTA